MKKIIAFFLLLFPLIISAQKQITVEVPDINKSTNEFIVLDNKIYYSLSAIKLVGENAAIAIIEEREQNGLYKDYNDFVIRTKSFLSQKIVEALIYSGALDSLGLTRKTMISEYEKSLSLGDYGELFRDELQTREYDQSEFNFKAKGRVLTIIANVFCWFGLNLPLVIVAINVSLL